MDVSEIEVATTLLGSPVSAPLFVPPMASHRLVDPEGELASAAAHPRWVQIDMYLDREVTADMIRRAEAAGYDGVCLTIDAPVFGQRYRDVRNRFR